MLMVVVHQFRLARIVVKNDIEEVLVSPCDVELVFLQQRHEQLLPVQPHRGHVILWEQTQRPVKRKSFLCLLTDQDWSLVAKTTAGEWRHRVAKVGRARFINGEP